MPLRTRTVFTQSRNHSIINLGDSLTDPQVNMGPEWTRWDEELRRRLEFSGAHVISRNLSRSGAKTGGATTSAGLTRMNPFIPHINPPYTLVPEMATIFFGTNDVRIITVAGSTWAANVAVYAASAHGYAIGDVVFVSGFTQASLNGWQTITAVTTNTFSAAVSGSGTPSSSTNQLWAHLDTTTFIRGLIRWMEFGCKGSVSSQTSLPVDAVMGDRYVVLYDTSSTGGRTLPASAAGSLAQITGSITNNTVGSSEPTAWEYRSGQTGETGWARVARATTTPSHISRIIVVENHYLNYSASTGDTSVTEFYPYDSSITHGLRNLQAAAVTPELAANVVLANAFSYFKALITNGTESQGTFSWHRADNDVHFSQLGHSYMADLIYTTITGQTGWLTAISS